MANWTNIPNQNLEPGAPVRAIDGISLRDNPVSIAEGDPNAPRIRTVALQPPEAGTTYLICRIQETSTTVGSGALTSNEGAYLSAGLNRFSDHSRHLGFTALVPGTVTCYLEHIAPSYVQSFVRLLKNGVQLQEWSTSSSSFVARQLDVQVDVGDVVIFQHRASVSKEMAEGATMPSWAALRVYSNKPDMAVS